jgi:DNA segregation ATPase FtsK/SpoIIIE, S-DNA-T family
VKYKIFENIAIYWIGIALLGLQIFLTGSLWTFSLTDSSWFYHATQVQAYKNLFGFFGSYAASWMIYVFGRGAFFAPFVTLYAIVTYYFVCIVKKINMATEWDRACSVGVGFFSLAALYEVFGVTSYDFSYPGGLVGRYIVTHLLVSFDVLVQKIILMSILFICFVLITRCSYLPLFLYAISLVEYCCDRQRIPARIVLAVYACCIWLVQRFCFGFKKAFDILTGHTLQKITTSIVEFEQENNVDDDIEAVVQDLFWDEYIDQDRKQQEYEQALSLDAIDQEHQEQHLEDQENLLQLDLAKVMPSHQTKVFEIVEPHDSFSEKNVQQQAIQKFEKLEKAYELPALPVKKVEQKVLQEKQDVLAQQAKVLEEKLAQFDIQGSVVAMHAGPVVTLFEYQPDIKVKVSRILSLEDDLAMALKALSIRIIAPIPGRSVVGFEVANQHRQDVVMARILQSQDFKKYTGALPMIFGQDTLGNDVIADLAKMPHLLIAGSTGSGKSVALNAMLVSLLCSLKPTELKLIIIDPKRLEFAAYDGIAHLLFPIVTETKKAIPILKWVVQTMEKRYEIMAKFGVRNLGDYKIAAQKNKEMEEMPFMVVIIDELADLMMTAGKAVEDSIARIAQMARAAGIHMIIATQRPSVDVITGMIKVNFPNRVAFKVTSKIDSRTILDAGGAEKLLGRGDMLFLDASKSHLVRVHGAYISDQEIHEVVAQIKKQCKVQYLDIFDQFNQQESNDFFDGDDELYQEIVQFIQELDEVSISMLQRRFRIGYNRSARFISILESKGLIMTVDGGKTRRVVK